MSRSTAGPDAAAPPPHAGVRRLVAALVFFTIWGLITHGTFAGSGDEPHYLIAAQSIAFDGDLDLGNNYAAGDPLIAGGTLVPGMHAIRGKGGVLRPTHDVGLPLLFAPVVRVAYPAAEWLARVIPAAWLARARLDAGLILRHQISLVMALVAAVLALQLFEAFTRTIPPRAAAAWALLVVLSPPLLSHAFLLFTEIPSALMVVWCFRALSGSSTGRLRLSAVRLGTRTPDAWRRPGAVPPPAAGGRQTVVATRGPAGEGDSDPDGTALGWLVLGGATGLLLLVHVRNIALVLGFAVWALQRLRRTHAPRASWIAWSAGLLVLLLVRTAVVRTFWGSWLTTPLASLNLDIPLPAAVRESLIRLSGLLFDQEFGLLAYAPIYLLFPVGVALARHRTLPGGRAALALAGMYVATIISPHVNVHGWTGGWAPAARMVLPIGPLLAIFVVAGWRRLPPGAARAVGGVLIGCQLAIDAVVWQWPKALWNYGDGASALFEPLPAIQRWLPSWHASEASAAPFVAVAVAWAALTWWLLRTAGRVDARDALHAPIRQPSR